MPKSLIVALIAVSLTVPVLAAETFYVIFDNTLKGCTVVTSEPSDKIRYKVLGKYNSDRRREGHAVTQGMLSEPGNAKR
jgi:hypothetical protein